MRSKYLKKLLPILLILSLGLGLRLIGLNWDQSQHLHPDERFLTMVALKLNPPTSLKEYLNPLGPLSPYGVGEYFFVYGTLPLNLTWLVARFLGRLNYQQLTLTGRFLSALFETGSLGLVFFLVRQLVPAKKTGRAQLIAGLLYATCVLPLQLAHFFAVDTFLVFFLLLALWLSLLTPKKDRAHWLFLGTAGISLGLGLACKLSALTWFPLIGINLFWTKKKRRHLIEKGLFLFLTIYFTLHLADPHLFASANLFNPRPNPLFIQNVKTLNFWNTPEARFPPGVQWLKTTPLYSLKHNFLWGLGVLLGGGVCLGLLSQLIKLWKNKKLTPLSRLGLYTLALFSYQSFQFSKPLRYFYPLYAILIILAANWLADRKKPALFIIPTLLYPIMFLSIYLKPHSRVTASVWLYQNLPAGSRVGTEYWDDALPLAYPPLFSPRQYQFESLDLYARETDQKWQTINEQLQKTDYLVLSSNRLHRSIRQNPDLYPQTSQYYENLFAGQSEFKLIRSFQSFPCFPPLGQPWFCLNDQAADETFTVYDHPQVFIFAKKSQ